jgi:hypothetical protein
LLLFQKDFLYIQRPTGCVSCGGWEGRLAVETEKLKARKMPKKRAAYPPSAARYVGLLKNYREAFAF